MAKFRILHASDLHFSMQPRQIAMLDDPIGLLQMRAGMYGLLAGHDPLKAAALSNLASDLRKKYDIFLITGDIATHGAREHLDVARAFITGDPTAASVAAVSGLGRPLSDEVKVAVRLLPGNHDRYTRFGLPGNREFDDCFAEFWRAGQGAQILYRGLREGQRLFVVGADFSLRAEHISSRRVLPFLDTLGQGLVDGPALRELRELTMSCRRLDAAAAIVWAIHFDPLTTSGALQLRRRRVLLRCAADLGVSAILCGHVHGYYSPSRGGHTGGAVVFRCGSTTQHFVPAKGGCNLQLIEIDVTPTGASATLRRRYHYRQGKFEHVA